MPTLPKPYTEGPPPDPNSAWPVGGWIDQWEDEAPDFQGFRDLTDSNAARGYSQVYHTGLARPTSLLLPANQGQSLLRKPTSLIKTAPPRGGYLPTQQAPIIRTRRIPNQVAPPPPPVERILSPPRREFDILEQLRKTQAKISIYELIKASEKYRDILMEVLKKARVPEDMPVETLTAVAAAIFIKPTLFFTDSELAPPERRTLPLNVTIIVNSYKLSGVLVDTGETLNVCSLDTLRLIGLKESQRAQQP